MKVKCSICGEEKAFNTMIRRKLNGRNHFCCCINCEVQWEKDNLMGICG